MDGVCSITYILHREQRSFYTGTTPGSRFLRTYTMASVLQRDCHGGYKIMRKCFWLMPILLATGCSRRPDTVAAASGGAPVSAAAAGAPATAAPVRNPVVIPSGAALHVRLDEELDTRRNR